MKNIVFTLLCSCLLLAATAQNIVQAEYFLDVDGGFGNNTPVTVTPATDGTFSFTVNLTTASIGYHKLYVRTKDNNGKWSFTTRRNIEVISPVVTKTVTAAEYFFDEDPGFGNATAASVGTLAADITASVQTNVSTLSVGYHKLYFRTRDIDGKWSFVTRRNIEIIDDRARVITGGEYFFITDDGVGSSTPFTVATPAADSQFRFTIPLQNIPKGATAVYVRVKDSVNKSWSFTATQSDTVVTSVKSGLWSDVNTWSNKKIPTASTIVVLMDAVTVDINATCRSLTPYKQTGSLLVNAGKNLLITGVSQP